MARIYQRGKTYYSDLFFPGHPKANKDGRLRIPLDTDKDFAQRKLGKLIEDRDAARHGRRIDSAAWPDFKTRLFKFLERRSKETRQAYQRAVRHLERYHPLRDLSQITPTLLEELYTEWKVKQHRPLYVRNKDMKCLKTMMVKAEAWQLVRPQEWELVKVDPEPRGRLLFYEIQEFKRMLKYCTGVWKTVALLGARAGLRRGEIHWLARTDIDFARNFIHVDSKPVHGWVVKNYERRSIRMTPDVRKHLKQVLVDGREWVLEENGWRPSVGVMSTYFKRIVRRAKLKGSIHTLRHSFAAWLRQAGRELEEIRDLLGHKSVVTTEIYAHLHPKAQREAIDSLPPL